MLFIYVRCALTAVHFDRTIPESHTTERPKTKSVRGCISFDWIFEIDNDVNDARPLDHNAIHNDTPAPHTIRYPQHIHGLHGSHLHTLPHTGALIFHNCKKILYEFMNGYGHWTHNRTQSVSDNGLHIFDVVATLQLRKLANNNQIHETKRNEMRKKEKKTRENICTQKWFDTRVPHIASGVEINNKCDLLMKLKRNRGEMLRQDASRNNDGHPEMEEILAIKE